MDYRLWRDLRERKKFHIIWTCTSIDDKWILHSECVYTRENGFENRWTHWYRSKEKLPFELEHPDLYISRMSRRIPTNLDEIKDTISNRLHDLPGNHKLYEYMNNPANFVSLRGESTNAYKLTSDWVKFLADPRATWITSEWATILKNFS